MDLINNTPKPITKLEVNKTAANADQAINVMITNVSKLSTNNIQTNERNYIDVEGNLFTGQMTNEAPIKSVAYRLGKKGAYLHHILFIESTKVKKELIHVGDTHYTTVQYLRNRIDAFLDSEKENTKYHKIGISNEPSQNDVANTVYGLYEQLMSFVNENKQINIYIEANGGVRYVLTMLLSLTKTLENYYENVTITEVNNMVLNDPADKDEPTKIINTKAIYDTAQITGIAEEFVNYGRTSALRKYMSCYKKTQSPEWQDIERVLNRLEKLADDIQLCRTTMILEDLYGKDNLLTTIEEYNKKYTSIGKLQIKTFKHILQLISDNLNQTIYRNCDLSVEQEVICYLPNVIEWCLQKSFIQQALTFCSERLGEYLVRTGKMKLGSVLEDVLKSEDTQGSELYCHFLTHLKDISAQAIAKIPKKSVPTDTNNPTDISSFVTYILDSYKQTDFRTLDDVNLWLTQNGFNKSDHSVPVHVSNKFTSNPLNYTLLQRIRNSNIAGIHINLDTKEKVCNLVKPVLERMLSKNGNKIPDIPILPNSRKMYDMVLDTLFPLTQNPLLNPALKKSYSGNQSKHYSLNVLLSERTQLLDTDNPKLLQEILYVYSICKKQRNLTNHATNSKGNSIIPLNSNQLETVIRYLLSLLKQMDEATQK